MRDFRYAPDSGGRADIVGLRLWANFGHRLRKVLAHCRDVTYPAAGGVAQWKGHLADRWQPAILLRYLSGALG